MSIKLCCSSFSLDFRGVSANFVNQIRPTRADYFENRHNSYTYVHKCMNLDDKRRKVPC